MRKKRMVKIIKCFFFKQKTAYEMRISDWSSDVCSSDLPSPTIPAMTPRNIERTDIDMVKRQLGPLGPRRGSRSSSSSSKSNSSSLLRSEEHTSDSSH